MSKIWIFLTLLIAYTKASTNFAKNLATCTRDSDIDVCLRNTLEELRALMPIGIPELRLDPTEPLRIDNLHFTQENEPVVIDTVFQNVIVRGLSKFKTESITVDPVNRRFSLKLSVPEIDIRGNYKINGKVFIFPITGEGPFTTRLNGVTGIGGGEIVPISGRRNDQILSIRNTNINFDIHQIAIRMENLFGRDEQLFSDTVNKFLNDNSDLVLQEIKPKITERMITLVERVMNDAFSQLSADELLANLNSRFNRTGRRLH